jgi:hypothetical protein
MAFLCLFGRRRHRHGKIVVFVVVLAFFFLARDRFFVVVAATIIAARPAMVDGVRLVAQPLLAIVATNPFLASTLVVSRPRFFWRRCLTLVALAAHSALATSHAVAFFFIVASFASKLAATAATITIVTIVIGVIVVSSTIRSIIVVARAIPELASRVARPARLAILAEVARESFFRAIAQTIDLVAINRRVFRLRGSPRRDSLHRAIRGAIAMSSRWLGRRWGVPRSYSDNAFLKMKIVPEGMISVIWCVD